MSLFVSGKLFHKAGEGAGGSGNQHNLGYYADLTALQTAHPTATDGDFAILGSTDTVWIWDSGTSAWVDSDQKGQVTSVNNQTGAVTIGINDILPDQTGHSGHVLGTDGFVAGWVAPEQVQRSAMPQASEDEEGNIYQFTGTTDSTYTNGHFYKCVSDGGNPATYSWTRVDVQPSGTSYTAGTGIDITGGVISVTSPTLTNTATGTDAITIGGTATNQGYAVNIGSGSKAESVNDIAIGANAQANGGNEYSVTIGSDSKATGAKSVAIGAGARALSNGSIVIGKSAKSATAPISNYSVAIGYGAEALAICAIQLGRMGTTGAATNSDANTFKVANANGNFEIMSADGTVPTARLTKVNTTVTLAAASWSSNTQTVNVTGMTATGVVFPCPIPADQADYTDAGIICSAQAAGILTFTCDATPTNDIDVQIVML